MMIMALAEVFCTAPQGVSHGDFSKIAGQVMLYLPGASHLDNMVPTRELAH